MTAKPMATTNAGSLKAEPVRDVRIIEAVVEECCTTGDEDCTEHPHVERFDICNQCKPRAGACRLTVVHAERAAVEREECGDEVVEQHVDDEGFHCAARRLLPCKPNGNGEGKENRHLGEYRPCALLDHIPEIVPERPFGGDTAEQLRVFAYDGHRHRQTKECKQNDGRIHCTAEPLHVLHNHIFAERHLRSSFIQSPCMPMNTIKATIKQKSRKCNRFAAFGRDVRNLYQSTQDEICFTRMPDEETCPTDQSAPASVSAGEGSRAQHGGRSIGDILPQTERYLSRSCTYSR